MRVVIVAQPPLALQTASARRLQASSLSYSHANCRSRPAQSMMAATASMGPLQGSSPSSSKPSAGSSVLASILSLSSVPYSSYVPEPKTLLHGASAEVKQLWSVAILVLMARASTRLRLIMIALLVLATMLTLPPRLWRPQLARLAGLCSLVFVFTAIGADGVPPVTSDRSLPAAAAATAAAAAGAGSAAAGAGGAAAALAGAAAGAAAASASSAVPASMAQAGVLRSATAASAAASYRYTLFHFGFITITRRSLALAVAFAGMSFVALQSASLCLVTTPPERMALAVGRALAPLGLLGLPVRELVLTVLLSLRFMATAFEEARNLCLGLASRGIDWRLQGFRGTAVLFLAAGTKLFSNLMARCGAIAQAMAARGFAGPEQHELHVAAPGERALGLADAALLGSVAALGLAARAGL